MVTRSIRDVVMGADGTPAVGMAVVVWPSFVASDGQEIVRGGRVVSLLAGGLLRLDLAPSVSAAATPAFSYSVVWHVRGGASVDFEEWAVPAAGSGVLSLADVRVAPATS